MFCVIKSADDLMRCVYQLRAIIELLQTLERQNQDEGKPSWVPLFTFDILEEYCETIAGTVESNWGNLKKVLGEGETTEDLFESFKKRKHDIEHSPGDKAIKIAKTKELIQDIHTRILGDDAFALVSMEIAEELDRTLEELSGSSLKLLGNKVDRSGFGAR